MSNAHLAIDLGASSGRAVVGVLQEGSQSLKLQEVHRFVHLACPTPSGPVWDLTGIWRNILQGISSAVEWCRNEGVELKSVGVDTWGVDWALLGASGELLSLPHCYRDPLNEIASEKVREKLGGFEYIYEQTGIQHMSLNTLFQYAARYEKEPKLFDAAERLVFLSDLFHFWLSGEIVTELSIASTSSMLSIETGNWDTKLLHELGLPSSVLGPIAEPGTVIGDLRKEVAAETRAPSGIKVIAPACHDTASAVAAVPAIGDKNWAYLSSGTWSLLGVEIDSPINSVAAREAPFTNERGVDGKIRFLQNIAGLWLVQELQRDLETEGYSLSFSELVEYARRAESGRTLIDPNYSEFGLAGGIQQKIKDFARNTQQPIPETPGQMALCCFESLAFCYSATHKQLESIVGRSIDVVHVVGGGSKNGLLNELTANATGKTVVTGPVEATAIGNILIQALGLGRIANLDELRKIAGESFPRNTFQPSDNDNIQELLDRFSKVTVTSI